MSDWHLRALLKIVIPLIIASPTFLCAQDYAKLAAKDPVIHVVGGSGSETIYFSKKHDASRPDLVVATAATGRSNTIGAAQITVSRPTEVATDVFAVILTVATSGYVEPGVPYDGTLLLYAKATGVAPVPIKFSIEDDSVVQFDVSINAIAIAVTDSASVHQRVRITNTGKATIGNFQVTSSTLVDPINAHRTQMNPVWANVKPGLLPGQTMDLDYDLPQPPSAGTYTGTIFISADSTVSKQIALTLQTRGPSNQHGVPLLLLILVVGVGFVTSTILDQWFGGGGLARAQAYLSIKASEKQLNAVSSDIEKWRTTLPAPPPIVDLPRFSVWLAGLSQQIDDTWQNFHSLAAAEIAAEADRYQTAASAANYLWDSVRLATTRWSGDVPRMKQAIDGVDSVALPSGAQDLTRYRNDLDAVLRSAAAGTGAAAQTATISAEGKINWSQTVVQLRIRSMNVFYQLVVGVVVLITAYMSFYAGHLAFGTPADFMAVFLWSLGLTTTGTQIISRVHRP